MHKALLSLLFIIISVSSYADSWEYLTIDQAKAIVIELEKNPYIFDYCDCCISETEHAPAVQFIKVIRTEIIQSEWSDTIFYVKAYSMVLAEVFYANSKTDVHKIGYTTETKIEPLICMNYTWAFNSDNKMATPFFNIVDYGDYVRNKKPCRETFEYPTPDLLKTVSKHRGYRKWYKNHIL